MKRPLRVRSILKVVFIGLSAVAVVAALVVGARRLSLNVRVASQPVNSEAQRALQTLAREIGGESSWLRFTRVPVAASDDAADAIKTGRADLAILRSDVALPSDGETIAILRRDDLFLIAPPNSPLESFRDLRNRKVAVQPGLADNAPLLDKLLTFYGVPPDSVTRVFLQPSEIGEAIQQKRVAAAFVVGAPNRGVATRVFESIAKAIKGRPTIVGVEEADAVAARFPIFESGEIPQGALGGRAPEEATTTVTVAYHLVANRRMHNIVAGEISRQLMTAKARLIRDPEVAGIDAPDTEQTNYTIHPGAKAYFDGEQSGWLDSLTNLFWIGSALVGGLGSLLTWALGRIRGRAEAESEGLAELIPFLREVREADAKKLAELDERLDGFVARVIAEQQAGGMEADEVGVYQLTLNYARQAINERRALLPASVG